MCNFFKKIKEAIKSLFSAKEKPKEDKLPMEVIEVVDNPEDDNKDIEKYDDGGNYEVYPKDEEKLYYPKAIKTQEVLRTRGYYKKNYPQGAVVHFTAGRSRDKKQGGSKNADSHLEMGKRSIRYAANKNSYCYFIIDRDGNVHQNFPLNRWGYHAGKSSWDGMEGSVSDEMVGIEVQCAGKLSEYYQNTSNGSEHKCPEGYLSSWFTRPESGDLFFNKEKECRYSKDKLNIKEGWYHAFSEEQEESLIELIIWLKRNNPDIFQFKNVAGHDEVSPDRKNDPGASLSMTMSDLRKLLVDKYNLRYNL